MKIFKNNKNYLLKYRNKRFLMELGISIDQMYEKLFKLHHNDVRKSYNIPYINREYYKHTFKPDEDVIIGFFVDDNDGSFYEEDKISYYKLNIYVDNKHLKTDYIVSGSQDMNLGNLSLGEHVVAYEVIDVYNKKSYRDYFEILIKNNTVVSKYTVTDDDLARYSIDKNGNDFENTVTGFNSIISNLGSEYNYLVIPKGTYQMKYGEKICMKDNLTLDLNDSHFILQSGQSGDTNLQFEIRQCYDSHIINGTIEGDYENHNYDSSPNNSEWVKGVELCGRSKYSSYSDITIKNITGYGSCAGMGADRNDTSNSNVFATVPISKSHNDKNDRDESDFIDLTKYKIENCNYFQVGLYLGYQGCPSLYWYFTIQFFDENKELVDNFIGYFYRRIYIPSNVKYCKVQSLESSKLNNNTTSFAFKVPVNCEFSNVKHYDCRCVGCAVSAMESLRLIGCYFTKCGQSAARCAFDAEDGWDMMHDFYMTNTVFENNYQNDWLTCAGHNFLLENNTYSGKIYSKPRCQNFTARNNNITAIDTINTSETSHHSRVYSNTCSKFIYYTKTLIKDCSASFVSEKSKKCIFTLFNDNSMGANNAKDIYTKNSVFYLTDLSGYIMNTNIEDSKFILKDCSSVKFQFNLLNANRLFRDCIFTGGKFYFQQIRFNSGDFENCDFENLFIELSVLADSTGIITFKNCTINFDSELIRMWTSPYNGGHCEIIFDKCTIIDTNKVTNSSTVDSGVDLIYALVKPTSGSITFKDCVLTKTNGKLLSGYYDNEVDNMNLEIIFDNTPVTDNLLEVDANFKSHVTITQK